MLNLRYMEAFRAVMVAGGLRGAAELLHVSEPAVSKLLTQMARQAGFRLFEKVRGRLVPTPEAQTLYAEVELLWRGVERVQDVTEGLAHPQTGTLRLATSASLAPALIPATLALLYQQFPNIKCYVEVLVPPLMADELLEGSTQLGVCLLPNDHPNLVREKTYWCDWVCVMHPDHPLTGKRSIAARDLVGQRVITSPDTTAYGHALRQAYGAAHEKMDHTLEVRSSTSACWLAQAGTGIALVDSPVVAGRTFPGLEVRPFRSGMRIEVAILRNQARPMSRLESAFCEAFDLTWKRLMGKG